MIKIEDLLDSLYYFQYFLKCNYIFFSRNSAMNRAIHHHAMYIIFMIFFVIVAVFTNTDLFYKIFLSQSIIAEDQLSFSKKLFEKVAFDRNINRSIFTSH